jgi:hypothetical protein
MGTQEQRRPLMTEPGEPVAAPIDWRLPNSRHDDWLFGTGAMPIEQGLVWAAAVLGLGLIGWQGVFTPPGWAWWHHLLSAVILLDVAGGAVANTLGTAKRLYFGPLRQPASARTRLLHNTVGFTALHLHPIVIAALYPGGQFWWGVLWYLVALGGVGAVRVSPSTWRGRWRCWSSPGRCFSRASSQPRPGGDGSSRYSWPSSSSPTLSVRSPTALTWCPDLQCRLDDTGFEANHLWQHARARPTQPPNDQLLPRQVARLTQAVLVGRTTRNEHIHYQPSTITGVLAISPPQAAGQSMTTFAVQSGCNSKRSYRALQGASHVVNGFTAAADPSAFAFPSRQT